jgi:C-terminal processing protease CtpA/Prc
MSPLLFSKLTLISSIILSLSLSGCQNETDTHPPIKAVSPLVGVWQAPAYGLVLDMQEDSHQFYQVTSESCQKFELDLVHDELRSSTVLSDDFSAIVTTFSGLKDPGMELGKENSLPDLCMNDLIANIGESNYGFDAQKDFEIFWHTFSQYYAFFSIENVDWDEVFQLANGQINNQTTVKELVEILTEMVEPLRDFHVNVINPELDVFYSVDRKESLEDIALQEFKFIEQVELPFDQEQLLAFEIYLENTFQQSIDAIVNHFVIGSDIKANENETLFWGRFENNIGYLNVTTMELEELGDSDNSVEQNKAILTESLDEIMQDFADVDGIIIDVRYNNGGDNFVSRMITSRLIDQSLHVYSKQARLGDSRTLLQQVIIEPEGNSQFLGPVAVMTSASTSSAAEIFAMSMRERAKTILVGEASGGGLSDLLPKSLPHGTLFTLSNEFYLTPDNEEFEGVGVPVDIEQAFFTLVQREQGIDLGLEQAKAWIDSYQTLD